jgi:hypothetical protein
MVLSGFPNTVKGRTVTRNPGLNSNDRLLVIEAVVPGSTWVSTVLQDKNRNAANTGKMTMPAEKTFSAILRCTMSSSTLHKSLSHTRASCHLAAGEYAPVQLNTLTCRITVEHSGVYR